MSDIGYAYKRIKKNKQDRHLTWYVKNIEIIAESEFKFKWGGDTAMLFRYCESVDFYPHTGRWKYKGKMYSGGAEHFLRWYRNTLPINYKG